MLTAVIVNLKWLWTNKTDVERLLEDAVSRKKSPQDLDNHLPDALGSDRLQEQHSWAEPENQGKSTRQKFRILEKLWQAVPLFPNSIIICQIVRLFAEKIPFMDITTFGDPVNPRMSNKFMYTQGAKSFFSFFAKMSF